MEFLLFQFDPKDRRDVLSSGNVPGQTGTGLMPQVGVYHIALRSGGPGSDAAEDAEPSIARPGLTSITE